VDPSSAISGGSILGDKTRMELLARRSEAFIRPSPAGNTLGGVARRSREALIVCEAAGFDVIIVETVGVGQFETMVADMTDMFVLLLMPGGGDELQAIKRGIMEMAELVLINKADGDLHSIANESARSFRNAVQYLRPRSEHWNVEVLTCSALGNEGIAAAWEIMNRHQEVLGENGQIAARRASQACSWMWAEVNDGLVSALRNDPGTEQEIGELERAVSDGRLPPNIAARKLLGRFLKRQ
jgi:LAO/AO transport system kinase